MNEQKLSRLMNQQGISIVGNLPVSEKALAWERAVKIILEPKTVSDRTCIRNISRWLVRKCNENVFEENVIFRRTLDFALEASGPGSRNPYAVFMYILKKELGYLKC